MQRSLDEFDLSAAELEIVKRALSDAAARKPAIDIEEWGPKIEAFAGARAGRVAAREKAASVAYLAKAAAEPGVVRTNSGLIYRDLSPGHRSISDGQRCREGSLPRHAHQRHRVRQLVSA
jgi:FKBP-type peptidyl-prolyl cis-trans isomerase FkpA